MKYLPLITASLRRKSAQTLLTFVSATAAFAIFAVMMGVAAAADGIAMLVMIAQAVAAVGPTLILFLTANATAHSVSERIPELAMLKSLGFGNGTIITLLFVETAIPLVAGAVSGLGLAALFSLFLLHLLPAGVMFPVPHVSVRIALWAMLAASGISFLITALPALRVGRLEIAAALARP